MKNDKIWTLDFITTTTLNFLFYLVFYLLTVIISTVAIGQYHASSGVAGALSGIFILASFFGRLIAGSKIGRFGIKKTLVFGSIFYLAMTLLYFVTPNIAVLVIVRFFHGLSFGISSIATGTLAGLIVPPARRGEALGYFTTSVTLAGAFGPFIAISLYHRYNFAVLLVVASAILAIALISTLFVKIPDGLFTTSTEKTQFHWSNYFEKSALPISFIVFLIGIAYSPVLSFLADFSTERGLIVAGSFFYVAYAITILITRPFTGRIFDTKGDNYAIYPTFVVFAIALCLVGAAHTSWLLLVAGALVGLSYGSFSPFFQTIAIRHSSPHRIALATSTFFGLYDMGVGVGPFIFGPIVPHTGYSQLYTIAAFLVVIVGVIYYFLHGSRAAAPGKRLA